jgi:hypothetical protein
MKQRLKILIGLFLLFLLIVISIIILDIKSHYKNRIVIIPKKHETEELVVVVCNEDVEEWLDDYAQNYQKVTIYNKCGKNIQFKSKNVEVIESPNIGTCDHGYLSYIIDRYNDLPDFVEFTKGWKPPSRKYYKCLPCKQNLLNNIKYNIFIKNFKLKNYKVRNSKNKAINSQYKPSSFNNMGDWIKNNNFLEENNYIRNFCNIILGGQFGVPSQNIRKTSKRVWENIRSQQKYPQEELNHYIERTWRPLLCKPKDTLVVVAMFKNASHCIREWLQHYMKQGVTHFYMIDNGSTDNWRDQIKGAPITVYTDDTDNSRFQLYEKYFFDKVKTDAEWVMMLDLSNFMYARNGYRTILEYLESLDEKIGNIEIKWKIFGSNNHIKQPRSIIKSFTKRKKIGTDHINLNRSGKKLDTYGKCIIKTYYLKNFGNNHNGNTYKCDKIVLPSKLTEEKLAESPIHMNHYGIQSLEWYNNKDAEPSRIKQYFDYYNFDDIEDNELLDIYENRLPLYNLHNYDGDIIHNTSHKIAEQNILKDTVKNGDRVLQLGAGIGTNCITAAKLGNLSTNHCVEPQKSVIPILKNNNILNNTNSEVIEGVVTENCKNKLRNCNSLHSIKPKNGYTYLFMDCDDCAPEFIKEYGTELSKHPLHTIVYEEDKGDGINPVNYTPVHNFMDQNNFKCEGNFHKVCKKNW